MPRGLKGADCVKKTVAIVSAVLLMLIFASCKHEKIVCTADDPFLTKATEAVAKITDAITQVTQTTEKIVLDPMGKEDEEDSVKGPLGYRTDADSIADITADFGFELFGYALKEDDNALISPVSVMAALAIAADGADGETLAEMEAVLGMTNEDLRKYYGGYVHPASSDEQLRFANSLWLRNDGGLQVNKNFVDRTVEAYGADVFSEPFDASTLKKINFWVSDNTDGEINNMLTEIPAEAVSYIINTVLFEAEWQEQYNELNVRENQTFVSASGKPQTVTMLGSDEYGYVELGKTKGFIKNYKGGDYAFVGLLPDEGVSVEAAAASFSGEDFINAVNNPEQAEVVVNIPKFGFDCKFELNEPLKAMGMPTAFSPAADFTNLGVSPMGNIYINRVLHNTFIRFDENGTKAGAATAIEMKADGAMVDMKYLTFNRPFIYAIIDRSTGMPIFIGAVKEFE